VAELGPPVTLGLGRGRPLSGALRLLDAGPGVAESHRPVEDEALRRRVRIDAEVAEPLELEAAARRAPIRLGSTRASRTTSIEVGLIDARKSRPSASSLGSGRVKSRS
jgi:hypothetical protein